MSTPSSPSRRQFLASSAALLGLACASGPGGAEAQQPPAVPAEEWRGVWLTRFEWTNGSRQEVERRLSGALGALAAGNFNGVVFQVRGQGDTLYPSSLEPWSPMLAADVRAGDPTAHALRECRRLGLQFHAWLNLSVIWQSRDGRHPADQNHPFWRWTNPRDRSRALGAVWDSPAGPRIFGDDHYVWLNAGNPQLEAYLRSVTMDFLRRYPADGLHFDDRTALPHGASFDPESRRRFAGPGNPDGIRDMAAWQRDQLGRMISNIYVQATAHNPRLLVSASPFGIADKYRIEGYSRFKDAKRDFGTDAEGLHQKGVLDVLMPQIYWAEGRPPEFSVVLRDWLRHNRSGRPIWPGSALGDYGGRQPLQPVQARYVALTRQLRAGGNTFFSWSAAPNAEWAACSRSFYSRPARVPVPPHKARPATGQIMGVVQDSAGRPVVDAWIRIPGRTDTYLSSGDGFFAIPNVPPGRIQMAVRAGSRDVPAPPVDVRAGQTATIRLAAG